MAEEAAEEDENMEDLELSEDIYCLTFAALMTSRNTVIHRELVLKAGISFMLQIILTIIVWHGSATFDKVEVAETYVNSARIIAAFLLHFAIIPEIKTALNMTQYAKMNYHKYRNWNATFAFMVSLWKLLGGVMCDVINMYVICLDGTIADVIKDYVAFGIIAEIDDIIFGTVTGIDGSGMVNDAGL